METIILKNGYWSLWNAVTNLPASRRGFFEISHLEHCKHTRRNWRREGIIQRPDRRGWRNIFHFRDFMNFRYEPATQVRLVGPDVNCLSHSYSFSLIALSLPSLPHSWSKVASAGLCSLTRQCHGAPSSGALPLWYVLTPWYVLPCVHVDVDSINCRAVVMMDASGGTAVIGVESASLSIGVDRVSTHLLASVE